MQEIRTAKRVQAPGKGAGLAAPAKSIPFPCTRASGFAPCQKNSRPVLTDCAGSRYRARIGEGRGFYDRSAEFSDFPARYDAPGSIAGHRRWVRVRAV